MNSPTFMFTVFKHFNRFQSSSATLIYSHAALDIYFHLSQLVLNHLYSNGFFLLIWYNKLGIIHCTYLGVSGYNLIFFLLFCLKIFFTCTKSVDPDEMPHHAEFHLGRHCRSTHLGVSRIQRLMFIANLSCSALN